MRRTLPGASKRSLEPERRQAIDASIAALEDAIAQYCLVLFTDTLMAWDGDLGIHVQSGDRFSQFYFRIPDAWVALTDEELQKHTFAVAQQMYVDLNAGFRETEPNDMSYMLVKSTEAMKLDPARADAIEPWRSAPNPAAWEPTPCVVVNDDGSYTKVTREAF